MKCIFLRICLATLVVFALLPISFIVWRSNLAHDVNVQLAAIHASGLPAGGAELNAYYTSAPDSENSAVKMADAFALLANYVIYSVGSDGQDNGGRERQPDAKSSDKTEYDITFTVER
jgi:hypothetical protein